MASCSKSIDCNTGKCVADDEVEDGAYVVLDDDEEEEDEEKPDAAQHDTEAQPDRVMNGSAAQLSAADDDRYVAEAYSAGEEQLDRSAPRFLLNPRQISGSPRMCVW